MAVLVADSYQEVPEAPPFIPWLEKAYARAFSESLEAALARQKEPLAAARWTFTLVKRLLPYFSLEEGYEFAYATLKGERQCLLQSVLVQGLLEQAGFRAGVYMVWRNPEGKESNLGHAVAVLRLEGRDYLVDPSEPEPFARHLGLFVATRAGYRFAEPVYAQNGAILGYRIGSQVLAPGLVQSLPFAFVRSQFYYYRGEQAKGGLFRKPSTPEGLRRSLAMLEKALGLDPANPLALYALGLVKAKLHLDARGDLERAYQLYLSYGHVPEGPKRALSLR